MNFDVLIVGGGIIGCAVARQLVNTNPGLRVGLVEKERSLAWHTSGRNSGVIHSGFNQTPGTLKAEFCVAGNARLRAYCRERGVQFEECGTFVVSRTNGGGRVIRELERRGRLNGVPGLRIIDREELSKLEPNVVSAEALYSPTGSIVDSRGLVMSIAREAEEGGAQLITGVRVVSLRERDGGYQSRDQVHGTLDRDANRLRFLVDPSVAIESLFFGQTDLVQLVALVIFQSRVRKRLIRIIVWDVASIRGHIGD